MPDRILDDRLQNQVRYSSIKGLRVDMHINGQTVLEAHPLDFQIAPQKLQFLLKCDALRPGILQRQPKKITEPCQHLIRRVHIFIKQRGNRVQSVKQKVRMKLHFERLQLSLGDLQLRLRELGSQSRNL